MKLVNVQEGNVFVFFKVEVVFPLLKDIDCAWLVSCDSCVNQRRQACSAHAEVVSVGWQSL